MVKFVPIAAQKGLAFGNGKRAATVALPPTSRLLANNVIRGFNGEWYGEIGPGFCTKARKILMLAGMVGLFSVAMWVKTIRARHQNDSERVKTLARSIYQQSVKQHLSIGGKPT